MPRIRGLDQLFADLDSRARPTPGSRNQSLQKFVNIIDVVLTSDTITTTVITPPFLWSPAPGSTANEVIWDLFEWA